LPAGTPFLFKLKAPNNHIAGGGYFATFSKLPLSMAWDAFGQKNRAATYLDVERRIRHLYSGERNVLEIGCSVLVQLFFFERKDWIPSPSGREAPCAAIAHFRMTFGSEREGSRCPIGRAPWCRAPEIEGIHCL